MICVSYTFDLGDLGPKHRGFALGTAEQNEYGNLEVTLLKACVYLPSGNLDVTTFLGRACEADIEEKLGERFMAEKLKGIA